MFKFEINEYSNIKVNSNIRISKNVIRIWKLDLKIKSKFESNFHIRITFLRFEYSNLP